MKKIRTVLTAIVMLFTVTAFATGSEPVSPKVKAAFQTNFSKATQVTWEKSNDFYFASFFLSNAAVTAAFNEDGQLVGTSRKVDSDQLPLSISLAIAEKYQGYETGKTATELTYEGQTAYYITVKNSSQEVNLKCYSNGDLNVESRTKK